jgi:hypothetical protein
MKQLNLDIGARKSLALRGVTGQVINVRHWRERDESVRLPDVVVDDMVEFWIKDEADGTEYNFKLRNTDVGIAMGQRLSIVEASSRIAKKRLLYLHNWNSRETESWCSSRLHERLGYRYGGWLSAGKALAVFLILGVLHDAVHLHTTMAPIVLIALGSGFYFQRGVRKFREHLPKAVKAAIPELIASGH